MLFDLLYPNFFPLFIHAASAFPTAVGVAVPLLKFIDDFVHNRAQRIMFDSSSPNGILLFREISRIICAAGPRILEALQTAQADSSYPNVYKRMLSCRSCSLSHFFFAAAASLIYSILTKCLAGSYVSFGVFDVYGDMCFREALVVVVKLVTELRAEEVLAFTRVMKAFYSLVETLCAKQPGTVLSLDTPVFLHLMAAITRGIQHVDTYATSRFASCLLFLCLFSLGCSVEVSVLYWTYVRFAGRLWCSVATRLTSCSRITISSG